MIAIGLAQILMGAFQGYAKYQEGQMASSQYESQGRILEMEAETDALRIEEEGRSFAANQKMMYIGSGVEVGGSVVVTLAQTDAWTKAEANNVRARGKAVRNYNYSSARIARNQGRAGFIGGIAGGMSNAMLTYGRLKPVKGAGYTDSGGANG